MTRLFQYCKYNVLKIILSLLMLLQGAVLRAQDVFDDAMNGRRRTDDAEDMFDEDAPIGFNLSRYTDEIVMLVILGIIIVFVRNSVAKKHKNGCTFFIIIFAILLYIYDRYFY